MKFIKAKGYTIKRGLLSVFVGLSVLFSSNVVNAATTEEIKEAQSALNELGYPCGTADGIAGNKTTEAIIAFQTDKGLDTSGEVTNELLDELGKALAEKDEKENAFPDSADLFAEDDNVKAFLSFKDDSFNGQLSGGMYYILGEVRNISDAAIEFDLSYQVLDGDGDAFMWGVDSHPCILPGKTELISIVGEYPGENYEFGYEVSKAASNSATKAESIVISSNQNSDGTVDYEISTPSDEGLNGRVNIFFYNDKNEIVASDECNFGGESPWNDRFDCPSESYTHYKICYTEYF